ncbi:RNA polymerase sigma factor, sigma-70 family [Aquimarina amphilecti]|uniref:RNA polymerase sigma factor, sigma-70 family n=1 Tax=Aquimarina amphilecti TaxID=1038014 RepID=A0A1H7MZA3_AQUAM|nr:RNA polymerase sigma factor [Aquimarina amphilecti]SEL16514.1 RNA polymerase sigma factor, sigma-70 family [Aquimarina amphilecti]
MANKKLDDYLLQSLKSGNDKGIKEIYNRLYPKVKSYIVSHDGSEDDAKDVMQKALLQLSARAQDENFKITSSFEGYFITICKNLWRRASKLSKMRVTNEGVMDLVHEEREIALATYEQEKWELFQEKLLEISQNCREVLAFFFNKVPYVQIAEKLGYGSENTVRQRIFKCKSKLKEAIHADMRYNELKEF